MFDIKELQLLDSVINEALNGFAICNFDAVIGMSRSELEQLWPKLNEPPEKIRLNQRQIKALRKVLEKTLTELGIEEFHSRTGFDIEEGERLVRKFDDLLALQKKPDRFP